MTSLWSWESIAAIVVHCATFDVPIDHVIHTFASYWIAQEINHLVIWDDDSIIIEELISSVIPQKNEAFICVMI